MILRKDLKDAIDIACLVSTGKVFYSLRASSWDLEITSGAKSSNLREHPGT